MFFITVERKTHSSFMLAEFMSFLTFRLTNEDWNVVVAVVVCTTFDFTLFQVPVVKSFKIKTNYRTSCSFTWKKKSNEIINLKIFISYTFG